MHQSRLQMGLVENALMPDAFVPYPAFLTAGLSWQQIWWQRQMYQRAWAAVCGPQPLRIRAADLPQVWRN